MRPPTVELVPPKNSIQEQLFRLLHEIKGLILRAKELTILGGTVNGWLLQAVPSVCSLTSKNNKQDADYVHSIPIN